MGKEAHLRILLMGKEAHLYLSNILLMGKEAIYIFAIYYL